MGSRAEEGSPPPPCSLTSTAHTWHKAAMAADTDYCCEAVRKRFAAAGAGEATNGSADTKQKIREYGGGAGPTARDQEKSAMAKEKKINKTKVSFFDFWYECIDWDMIKLFYAMMMLFFCTVGFTTMIYLLYVFNYNEKMWYYYFPVSRKYREDF